MYPRWMLIVFGALMLVCAAVMATLPDGQLAACLFAGGVVVLEIILLSLYERLSDASK